MDENIKKIKLKFLQLSYKNICDIILNFSNHVNYLFEISLIDYSLKQFILNILNETNKNINATYNDYIVTKISEINELDKWYDTFKSCDMLSDNMIDEIFNFNKFISIEHHPFYQEKTTLLEQLSLYGYNNLHGLLEIFIGKNYNNLFDKFVINNIDEINEIFIPISINIYDVNKSDLFYWRKPQTFHENDLLEHSRELWIKYNNKYLKISGIFKNDMIGVILKTAQIKYLNVYEKKNNIEKILNKNSNKVFVDDLFYKKFIKYDYIGNLYTYTTDEYIAHINKYYKKFVELSASTFLIVMKQFISESSNLKNMYDIIFILLLGNNVNIDIAGLLLDLTKEKKSSAPNIFKLINNNLNFNLQVKLKKSTNNIKQELEKIKSLSIEEIDYKKILISNKNISQNVKTLTLEKIQEMKLYNNEYYKQLTFVKNIINFPWSSESDSLIYENIKKNNAIEYLSKVENKLNNSCYGHEEAKKSLLQIIGKWISNPNSMGSSFGFVGPPGVGKTLLAKSVSMALDIPFAQITLGGQNDGELLHGHGYTYSGSQPGLIVKKMVEAGNSRCILYFDELDKSTSKHGSINEITSILIHLTDPNMNKTFQDRFFQGVDFPLDKVIMIFSYNDSTLVDPILLDRIKEINIKPYSTNEKIKIVKEFIIPEMIDFIGLKDKSWTNISEELCEYIIDNYTNEAGVRDIKRCIEKLFLTLNLDNIYKRNYFEKDNNDFVINKEVILNVLDKPKIENTKIHNKPSVGIINGMYATTNGDGGIIPIQIFNNFASMSDNFDIKLTGKQGDVMKESVQCSLTAALYYINRHLDKFKHTHNIIDLNEYIKTKFKHGFHIHTPSTSTPKDGPSAGCAFTSAFISIILNRPIKNDIAMTGEIELTGKITKIGGLNFKLIGAKKAGIKLVYVPKENEKDLEEIKENNSKLFNDDFQTKYFDYIDDIIDDILV